MKKTFDIIQLWDGSIRVIISNWESYHQREYKNVSKSSLNRIFNMMVKYYETG